MDEDNCIDSSMLMNGWATYQDIESLDISDKRTVLIEYLHEHLDGLEHSLPDLAGRETISPTGGLCGLSFLYKALHDTVLTKSQLKSHSLLTMKRRLLEEMEMDEILAKTETDKYVLGLYYDFVCAVLTRAKRETYSSVRASQAEQIALLERPKRSTLKDEEARFYGNTLVYECGLAREFYDPETDSTYLQRNLTCNWNKTWTPVNELDTCVWVACINPPTAPYESKMKVNWDGNPVNFTNNITYTCNNDGVPRYFENNRSQEIYNLTCLPTGSWLTPTVWPRCLDTVSCSEPPPRPESGTWEWDGSYAYQTKIIYTCGPNGKFKLSNGSLVDEFTSICSWNKSFVPIKLPECVATSCPIVPVPPKYTGLQFYHDPANDFRLDSPYSKYNPPMPAKIPFPGPDFCQNPDTTLKIIGKLISDKRNSYGHIAFETDGQNEAFHVKISLFDNVVYRHSLFNNSETTQGFPGDGTSLDLMEPFLILISCDEDGWVFQEEGADQDYPHFLHQVPLDEITQLHIYGSLEITYAGFVDKALQPSPPVMFNITFKCPQGKAYTTFSYFCDNKKKSIDLFPLSVNLSDFCLFYASR